VGIRFASLSPTQRLETTSSFVMLALLLGTFASSPASPAASQLQMTPTEVWLTSFRLS
jgi:hypothetical protein